MKTLLLSAAIGDIGGEPYEFGGRTKDYHSVNLLLPENTYTDDTVCTFACADALLHNLDMAKSLRIRCRADMGRGFGGMFARWLIAKEIQPPYNSFGNGSGMRVSAAGFMAKTKEECIDLATRTALPTHNHPEGIKGAVATALAIYYGMDGKDKDFIRTYVLDEYYPNWSGLTYEGIKPGYGFDETCQQTIPAALICFLESKDYADCLKLAISLGGDADTLAAIAIATAITNCIQTFGIGILIAVSPLLSNYRGEGKKIENYFYPSLKFAFILSLFVCTAILCFIPVIDKLGFAPNITPAVKDYFFITAFATFGGYLHCMTKEYLQTFEIVVFPLRSV